jgi:hypothetical protein
MNSKPSVAAAGGKGARSSTTSQNGPVRSLMAPPSPDSLGLDKEDVSGTADVDVGSAEPSLK